MTGPRRIRVLWVTQELPDRQLGGGNIRQAELIAALGRSMDIHLVLIGTLRDERTRRALSGLTEISDPGMPQPRTHIGARLTSLWIVLVRHEPREVFLCRRQRRVLTVAIRDASEGCDVVVVNHQGLIPLLPAVRRTPWVLALQYVSAHRTRHWLATAREAHRRWLFDREAALEERLEAGAVASYDGVIVVSADDADRLAGADALGAGRPMWIVPNGVDTSRITPTPLPPERRILLSASLNYPPNADGAVWFCAHVLPLVREAVPDVEFDIVGREPGPDVTALGGLDGVAVHGDVPDMLPWLQRCRVAVVPLRLGTGTRLKALEALAAGRPVVGTTIGLEGLDLIAGRHAVVADEPAAMAEAIVRLLVDDGEAERLRAAGRHFVEDRYRWEAIAATFAAELTAWLERGSDGSGA